MVGPDAHSENHDKDGYATTRCELYGLMTLKERNFAFRVGASSDEGKPGRKGRSHDEIDEYASGSGNRFDHRFDEYKRRDKYNEKSYGCKSRLGESTGYLHRLHVRSVDFVLDFVDFHFELLKAFGLDCCVGYAAEHIGNPRPLPWKAND